MNEFVARNGLIALDSSSISGPLTVSDNVAFGSGTGLFWNNTNGRLGIGINNPAKLIHLETTEPEIRFKDTNSGFGYVIGQIGDSFEFVAQNTLAKWNFNQGNVLIGGNVGIGVTSPTAKLHVAGTSLFTGNASFTGPFQASSLGFYTTKAVFGQPSFQIPEIADLLWQADKRFTLTGFPANPQQLFLGSYSAVCALPLNTVTTMSINIAGQSGVAANGYTYPGGYIYVSFYGGASYNSISLRTQNNSVWYTAAAPTDISTSANYKVLRFSVPQANYLTDIELTVDVGSTNVWMSSINYIVDRWVGQETPFINKYSTINTLFGDLDIKTNSNTNNIKLSGTSNSYLGINNNVGIGTSSPSTKLEVSGDNNANIVRLTSTSNLGTTLWAGVTSHDIQFNYTDGSSPGIYSAIRIIGNSESGLPDGGTVKSDFTIWTGGYQIPLAERLRITAQGNIGVGTSSPLYSLDVLSPTGTEPLTTNTDNYAARIKRTYTNTSGSVSSRRYNTFFETRYTGNQAYTNANGLNNYINYQNTNANSVIFGMSSYIEPTSIVSASSLTSFAAQVGTGGSITSVTGYNSNLLSLTAGTTTNARLFRAEALGSTNTVTNLYGFIAESTLTSATNNYGFYGNIATGTGRWNLYMAGTAFNYLAGKLGVGVSSPTEAIHIVGNLRVQTTSAPDSAGTASIILNPEVSTPATIQVLANFGPTSSTTYSAGFKFITRNRDASLANPYYDVDAMSILANGNVGIGTTTDTSAKLHISGSTGALLRVSSNASSNILFISSSGNVGIGTTSPTSGLDVNTSARFRGTRLDLDSTTRITGNYVVNNSEYTYLVMYNGSNASINMGTRHQLGYISFEAGNGAYNERMRITNTGNIGINTTLPTYRLDINGSFRASGSITATSGSDYFDISHDITQPAQTGSQVYEVNITPTLRYTAPNQTQTALRVAATFTGSTALSSSQSNIIADFGSTSAGSQLVINDTTSGSIYMVNDVSGLPIIEANSNWDVFIYDYPNVVLKKTGSQIDITGKLKVSGSFILPLSQSTSPETGSAYWSGSFLYIYDGAQYRSASFS